MRKHVKPAHPDATIPDPARKTDLPPEGRVVEWSVHWARLHARGDITAKDVPDEDEREGEPVASKSPAKRTAPKRAPKGRKPEAKLAPTAPADAGPVIEVREPEPVAQESAEYHGGSTDPLTA